MMKQNEQTECAMAVALAVFDFIQLVGDEIVYDVNRASDLIQEFGDRRVREAWRRPRRGKIVPLRVVGRA
jgi:hypothetical protein